MPSLNSFKKIFTLSGKKSNNNKMISTTINHKIKNVNTHIIYG